MYNYNSCPVCKSGDFKHFMDCKDYTVSKEIFTIVECKSCRFKFTNPIPEVERLGNYYKSEDYISHSNTKKGLISRLYHLVRNYTLKGKIKLVSEYVSRGTILDYGCGTGMFLKTAKESGWKTFGIEPDESARKLAKEYNSDIYDSLGSLDKTIDNGKLSAITLWHVLEHVSDLYNTLDFFSKKINEKGVLIIAVPNHISNDAKFYKEYWAAYDVPRHLYHFEKVTMEALLANHNFKLVQTKAMKFDSFYVSMLSEKYKTGAINYLAAFISGLRSNWSANSAEEYSSVIYIFKKDI